ncbi:MAG TPA: tetratricopeptide repeat protein, partial [Phycisphaerales bacterium]|nr:tetratricopeptide repeat protein [Phycisphaerales bacterium]
MRAYRRFRGQAGVLAVFAYALGAGADCGVAQTTQNDNTELASPELRQLNAANGFLERGLYDEAAKEYRGFLDSHAGDAQAAVARYGLGVSLYRLHKYDEAAAELEKVYKLPGFNY